MSKLLIIYTRMAFLTDSKSINPLPHTFRI